ncbi:hypothetical protein R3P38DRAFT_2960853 [Favolaschia claudopus]|uniref:Uncharacterized protein n=1 Tax=Favolaschia claudopus TaxID=2862362 RepID=A0AAW0B8Q5_9AGAR
MLKDTPSLYFLAPRLHTLLSSSHHHRVPPSDLTLTGGAVSVPLRYVLALHSFVNVPEYLASQRSAVSSPTVLQSFTYTLILTAFLIALRSFPHARSILTVFTTRNTVRLLRYSVNLARAGLTSYPATPLKASMHPDAHSQFRLSLFQRSLAHMGSILLVLYFGFIEIKSIARLCDHTGILGHLKFSNLPCSCHCSPAAVLRPRNSPRQYVYTGPLLFIYSACLSQVFTYRTIARRFPTVVPLYLLSRFAIPIAVMLSTCCLRASFQSSCFLSLCDGSHIRNGFSLLMLVHLPLGRHSRCFDMGSI